MTNKLTPVSEEKVELVEHYSNNELVTLFIQGKEWVDKQELLNAAIESVAKAIYAEMECLDPHGKPEWVENGNSLKQDEARKKARQALDDIKSLLHHEN